MLNMAIMKCFFPFVSGVFCLLPVMSSGASGAELSDAPVPVEVTVKNLNVPTVVGRDFNVVAEIHIDNDSPGPGAGNAASAGPAVLDEVCVTLSGLPRKAVRNVKLMYTGTMSAIHSRTTSFAMRTLVSQTGSQQMLFADSHYALELCSVRPSARDSEYASGRPGAVVRPGSGDAFRMSLSAQQPLVKGDNWFYVSVSVDPRHIEDMSSVYSLSVDEVAVSGKTSAGASAGRCPASLEQEGCTGHRLAVALRDHGDDGVFSYRIPGLVTTPSGTLIAVYDVRHHTSLDLQEDIDVGMSRSTDGGRTWEKMKIIMDMGRWGGLPDAQNGIGDPAVLVDENTGEIFVVAVWTHGLGNDRAWNQVGDGFGPETTAQLMMVSSKDDGKTWSEPRNVTRQVKAEEWRFTLQGPGRGICMSDGTLVFPIQYVGPDRVPNAGIMYSLDHGETWHCHGHAWTNTTESQAAEVAPGVVMLNMRNNRGTGRIVCTTEDLGRTWTLHPSSEKLREPVCMAGLLQVDAQDNVLGRDILLFSNPDTVKGRNHITIKASLDGGLTWLPENSLLLDEEEGWGYSCLTMIDSGTVGILYEGSVSQLVFQTVRIADIVSSDE